MLSAITELINIRNRTTDYNYTRFESLRNTIDNALTQFTTVVSPINSCVKQAKSIDDKIDDVVDSMCGNIIVAKVTGVVLATFYSYAYYMWFNNY